MTPALPATKLLTKSGNACCSSGSWSPIWTTFASAWGTSTTPSHRSSISASCQSCARTRTGMLTSASCRAWVTPSGSSCWPGEKARVLKQMAAHAARDAAGLVLPKRWREKQELLNLFQLMYVKLERGREEPSEDLQAGSSEGDSTNWRGYMEVALFFCTVRAPSGRRTPDDFFGRARAHTPSTGFVRVSLPDFDDVASNGADLPFLWRSYRKRPTGNTSKSLAIESCIVMDLDCHIGHIVGRNGAPREAIVFIHGFNCRFASAAKYMALYAYKMRRDVPIFVFSWPSFQSLDLYEGDQANATWSVRHFASFLKRLMTSYRLERVHVFAHSMGSQVAINGLLRLTGWSPPKGAARPGQLVLAAPDFDTGEFFEAQSDLDKLVDRVSVYCSANDKALRMSERVHGGLPRLGHFRIDSFLSETRHVALSQKVDVIDASGFDKSVVGHDYAFTSTDVIEDVLGVFLDGVSAAARPALRAVHVEKRFLYWRLVGVGKKAPKKREEEVVESQMGAEGMDAEGDPSKLENMKPER
ncbi:hypothetical protein KFL_000240240 [Klebsormidium nitens]|uniref:Alpha/beta-Hydrolases superfamily protein n=1 Tax=Klebsormidium nitens TaxID=105231 RepID=A0A1Y1HM69_KLENI|nr:hypothetical protein KFL_000240240 [Klebsormidium nitens]|eukprot:GAQ79093.1 hypothetical protein KFL_000240240 [Klebsormidium nitens]